MSLFLLLLLKQVVFEFSTCWEQVVQPVLVLVSPAVWVFMTVPDCSRLWRLQYTTELGLLGLQYTTELGLLGLQYTAVLPLH